MATGGFLNKKIFDINVTNEKMAVFAFVVGILNLLVMLRFSPLEIRFVNDFVDNSQYIYFMFFGFPVAVACAIKGMHSSKKRLAQIALFLIIFPVIAVFFFGGLLTWSLLHGWN